MDGEAEEEEAEEGQRCDEEVGDECSTGRRVCKKVTQDGLFRILCFSALQPERTVCETFQGCCLL